MRQWVKNATRSYLVFTCVDNERGELRAMPCSEKLVNTWKRTILDEPNIEGLTIKPNWIPDKPYHIKHQILDTCQYVFVNVDALNYFCHVANGLTNTPLFKKKLTQ